MSVNKAILVGNLGKDPELRYTPSGAAVATFSLATSERYKGRDGQQQEKTEWHNIVAWRQLAEICGKFLHKGKQVYIDGRIQTRSYDDKDGNKRYITEIVADQMQMLGGRQGMGGPQGGGHDDGGYGGGEEQAPRRAPPPRAPMAAPAPRPVPQAPAPAPRAASGFDDMDDDIPF